LDCRRTRSARECPRTPARRPRVPVALGPQTRWHGHDWHTTGEARPNANRAGSRMANCVRAEGVVRHAAGGTPRTDRAARRLDELCGLAGDVGLAGQLLDCDGPRARDTPGLR
jgi:hypothetical protein